MLGREAGFVQGAILVATIVGSAMVAGGCRTTQDNSAVESLPNKSYAVFDIEPGSRADGAWNSPEDPIILKVGRSLVLQNSDNEPVGTWISTPDCPIAVESCNSLVVNEIQPDENVELGKALSATHDKLIGVKGRYRAPCHKNEQVAPSENHCETREPVLFIKVVD